MTQKEKVGLGVLVGLFIALGLALFATIKRPSNSGGSFENNVIIEQRVRNLNKN